MGNGVGGRMVGVGGMVGVGREGWDGWFMSGLWLVGSFPFHCKWEVGNKEWECVGCVCGVCV